MFFTPKDSDSNLHIRLLLLAKTTVQSTAVRSSWFARLFYGLLHFKEIWVSVYCLGIRNCSPVLIDLIVFAFTNVYLRNRFQGNN
jgi:hypothetical protein